MNDEFGQNLGRGQGETLTRPAIKRTPLMLAVEQRFALPGESIGDLLERMYVQENKLIVQISRQLSMEDNLKVSSAVIGRWMKRLNPQITIKKAIELHNIQDSLQNPEIQKRRIDGLRAAWQNREKRKDWIAKIHTPESNAARGQTKRRRFEEHPEEKANFIRAGQTVREKRRKELMRTALGKNPKQTLERFIQIDCLSVSEISFRTGIHKNTINSWFKVLEISLPDVIARKRQGADLKELTKRKEKIQKAQEIGVNDFLTDRERQVLELLYMGTSFPTEKRIGQELNLTGERIRQIDSKAMAKIEKFLKEGADALKKPKKETKRTILSDKLGET